MPERGRVTVDTIANQLEALLFERLCVDFSRTDHRINNEAVIAMAEGTCSLRFFCKVVEPFFRWLHFYYYAQGIQISMNSVDERIYIWVNRGQEHLTQSEYRWRLPDLGAGGYHGG